MKTTFFSTLFLTAVVSGSVAAAETLTLSPSSLLEELRTGVVTIKGGQLSTAQGEKVDLRLMKQLEDEYDATKWYYEVIEDNVHLCGDGSKATHIELISRGSSVVVLAYQARTNTENKKEYIAECEDYLYTL